ncbi:hypothetical protein [Engelhardtia mirabilis]|uniref:Uncharacterized protein n=1 Tax=Engelhardtia mirabilis TaxID=2528011 RepID=A0A518BQY5_9BACT|nr:hypothetical protein Pla133_44790 [Planctomycetes bacterium Pla133]QDV03686.1 hypothetical protein Pla86_44770 [Planctomycetes bacterium Pla86]
MNHKLLLLPTACVGLGLAGWRVAGDQVAFGPSDGTTVTKTFSNEFEMELDDFSMIVGGQDIGAMLGTPEMNISSSSEITFTDEYGGVADGRPSKLTRTFGDLSSEVVAAFEMMGESQEDGSEMSSPMEGIAVVFTWNEESDDFDVAFAEDSEGDDALLEGLTEDTDLRQLLPAGEVEVDATWDFSPKILQGLLLPGGDLSWETEDMPDADMAEFEEMFSEFTDEAMSLGEGLMDGTGTATYRGTREIDGRQVAVIGLEVEIGSSADFSRLLTNIAERALEQEDVPDDAEVDIQTADVSLDVEAEGELLWDLATGTPLSLTMSGDFDVALDVSVTAAGDGEEMDFEASVAMSGPFTSSLTTSR